MVYLYLLYINTNSIRNCKYGIQFGDSILLYMKCYLSQYALISYYRMTQLRVHVHPDRDQFLHMRADQDHANFSA